MAGPKNRLDDSTGVHPDAADAVITINIQMHSVSSKLEALACGTGSGSLGPVDDEALSEGRKPLRLQLVESRPRPRPRPSRGLCLSPDDQKPLRVLALQAGRAPCPALPGPAGLLVVLFLLGRQGRGSVVTESARFGFRPWCGLASS